MNKCVLIGRITKDPELRFIQGSGAGVCTFTLAVDRRKSKDGKQEADFIPIVTWNKVAENVANFQKKGSMVGVSGRIQTRNYDNKEGKRVYVTEVIADEVQFLSKKNGFNNAQGDSKGNNTGEATEADITPIDGGDIPF